jgi:hypothetical protein
VRLQRRSAVSRDEETSRPEDVAELSALMERASIAVRQMKYFILAAKHFSLEELASSATRAGFIQREANPRLGEAAFEWASGQPDLLFLVSFRDPARVSIVAETQADLFGLVLTAYSSATGVSVELNPTIEDGDLGRNALLFKNILLTFPGFDDRPAWAMHPEGQIPKAPGLVEMWRDGVSLVSLLGRTWASISPRLLTLLQRARER